MHNGLPAPTRVVKEIPMTLPSYAVDFRGYPACPCLAAWLPVYEAELQRRGILTGPLRIYQLIGTYSGSGGTHATGGAFDLLDLPGEEDLWVGRQMGADAYWTRQENWDGKGGMRHNHGVLSGCPHNGPAKYQIAAVEAGFNGLGTGGRGAPDDGPRPLSGRSWRQGIAWAHQQQEDDMADPKTQALLNEIAANAERAATAAEKAVRLADRAQARDVRLARKVVDLVKKGRAATEADLEQLQEAVRELDKTLPATEA